MINKQHRACAVTKIVQLPQIIRAVDPTSYEFPLSVLKVLTTILQALCKIKHKNKNRNKIKQTRSAQKKEISSGSKTTTPKTLPKTPSSPTISQLHLSSLSNRLHASQINNPPSSARHKRIRLLQRLAHIVLPPTARINLRHRREHPSAAHDDQWARGLAR